MKKPNDQTVIEKAKAFAHALANSQEFRDYYDSQVRLKKDGEARAILEKFQSKQQEFQEVMMTGHGKSDTLLEEIVELQKKLQANDTIVNWIQAEQVAIRLIREANDVISREAGFDFGQNASSNTAC